MSFEETGAAVGRLVDEKNKAYGAGHIRDILRRLYPNGIEPRQYGDLFAIVRILDKMFGIANDKNVAFEEDPWQFIARYAIQNCRNARFNSASPGRS
jgi:hypothetical protein